MIRSVHVPLIALVVLLILMGLVFQASASQTMTRDIVSRQIQWSAAALIVGVLAVVIPYSWLIGRAWFFYLGVTVLLVLVVVFAPYVNGSRRWFEFGGAKLQPSELMKPAFILMMAGCLRFKRNYSRFRSLVLPGVLMTIPVGLIFSQPDLGTAVLFIPVGLGMLYVAGARTRHMAIILLAGVLVSSIGYGVLLKPYQRERVVSTIMRDRLPPAERAHKAFQLEQALRSVGNGGWFGEGYGQGIQNRLNRVPHRHNDFIFAVVAEEAGFIGSSALLFCILILLYCSFRVGWSTRDEGGRLICVGAAILYGTQCTVHLGVNLGLIPTTGMTLPFVSYGGSALITFSIVFALVINVGARRPSLILSPDSAREQMARLRSVRSSSNPSQRTAV